MTMSIATHFVDCNTFVDYDTLFRSRHTYRLLDQTFTRHLREATHNDSDATVPQNDTFPQLRCALVMLIRFSLFRLIHSIYIHSLTTESKLTREGKGKRSCLAFRTRRFPSSQSSNSRYRDGK
jgi:hypothetical protein